MGVPLGKWQLRAPCVRPAAGRDVITPSGDVGKTKGELRKGGSLVGEHHMRDYSHMGGWGRVGCRARRAWLGLTRVLSLQRAAVPACVRTHKLRAGVTAARCCRPCCRPCHQTSSGATAWPRTCCTSASCRR